MLLKLPDPYASNFDLLRSVNPFEKTVKTQLMRFHLHDETIGYRECSVTIVYNADVAAIIIILICFEESHGTRGPQFRPTL